MKFSATIALAVIVSLVASNSALPAQKRMIYYQRPAQYSAAPQRMMFVQYVQPSKYVHSTQGAEALVAGQSVATGTYVEDCETAEGGVSAAGPAEAFVAPAVGSSDEHGEDVLSKTSAHDKSSEGGSYSGEENLPTEVDAVVEEKEVLEDDAKVPHDLNLEEAANSNVASEAVPVEAVASEAVAGEAVTASGLYENSDNFGGKTSVTVDLPSAAPAASVAKPNNHYLPTKKKVYIELDHSVESAEDTGLTVASKEDEDEDEESDAPVAAQTPRPVTRRTGSKKPTKAGASSSTKPQTPNPFGTFFPVHFTAPKGGAIAIANSFSTGEGGSATSHAVAYGNPDAASLRGCVTCKKH